MKAKPIVTAVLLLFVAVSVVALIAKESRKTSGTAAAGTADESRLPDDGLVVYYFHGDVRCPTCRSIEAQAHDAVAGRLADELASGRVVWQVVNYEAPADAHYVDDYQLVSPTVVLSQRHAGGQTEWRNLERVWELVGDPPAFAEYVEQEVRNMLAESGQADAQISLKTTQGGR
jgi:hypothetical protein